MDFIATYTSELGEMTLACDADGLIGIWFKGQRFFGASLSPSHTERERELLDEAKRWLDVYFSGRQPSFTPPLSLRGTEFQKKVWKLLMDIPYGKTVSYGELARRLAEREGLTNMSPRAVGNAVGRNPLSILVPCHRVIPADGSLGSYAGGPERKKALLILERAEFTFRDRA